ncbi:MAG: hypothetical protein DRQ43_00900, partial [Gammaproteobacteria bacterium]
MADEDLDLNGDGEGEGEGDEAPKSSKKMMIIIIAGVVLLLIAGVVAGMFFGGFFDDEPQQTEISQSIEDGSPAKEGEDTTGNSGQLSYSPLEPHFVLNFEGKSKARFMQIGLEVSTTNAKSYAAFQKHLPVIRNEIVFLLSGQKYEEMVTPEGKEQLRSELIETINNILKKR